MVVIQREASFAKSCSKQQHRPFGDIPKSLICQGNNDAYYSEENIACPGEFHYNG